MKLGDLLCWIPRWTRRQPRASVAGVVEAHRRLSRCPGNAPVDAPLSRSMCVQSRLDRSFGDTMEQLRHRPMRRQLLVIWRELAGIRARTTDRGGRFIVCFFFSI